MSKKVSSKKEVALRGDRKATELICKLLPQIVPEKGTSSKRRERVAGKLIFEFDSYGEKVTYNFVDSSCTIFYFERDRFRKILPTVREMSPLNTKELASHLTEIVTCTTPYTCYYTLPQEELSRMLYTSIPFNEGHIIHVSP